MHRLPAREPSFRRLWLLMITGGRRSLTIRRPANVNIRRLYEARTIRANRVFTRRYSSPHGAFAATRARARARRAHDGGTTPDDRAEEPGQRARQDRARRDGALPRRVGR